MVHYKEALFCDQSLKRADTYFEIVEGILSRKLHLRTVKLNSLCLLSVHQARTRCLLSYYPYLVCLCSSYFAHGTCQGNSEDNGGSPVPPLFRILRFCKKRGVSSEASAKVSSRQSTPTQSQMLPGRDRFQSRKPKYMTGRTRRPTRAAHISTILKTFAVPTSLVRVAMGTAVGHCQQSWGMICWYRSDVAGPGGDVGENVRASL